MTTHPTDATKEVQLPQGTIRYRELGPAAGEPLVFVHGLLVNGRLWERVTPVLAENGIRCLVPDWPMGSHAVPMNEDADLGGYGQARNVADFIGAVGLDSATLVGNDSGGAICQIVATEHPEVVSRLVLTNCDSFDKFPPAMFGYLKPMARIPGGMTILAQSMRIPANRRLPISFGSLSKKRLDGELLAEWVRPVIDSGEIRRDVGKFIRGMHPDQTRKAAEKLADFKGPALFTWGRDDRFFKLSDAERLAAIIPDARVEPIDDAKTFVSLDQPERVADLISAFVAEKKPAEVG
jgi:pimeloyl-ACP methyl ester carboxylesterase